MNPNYYYERMLKALEDAYLAVEDVYPGGSEMSVHLRRWYSNFMCPGKTLTCDEMREAIRDRRTPHATVEPSA